MDKVIFIWLFLITVTASIRAETLKVVSIQDLQVAVNKAEPGDTIIVLSGKYITAGSLTVAAKGTGENPVIIRAETAGKTEISGAGGFIITAGSCHITIEGFRFTHSTGTSSIAAGATHCTIKRNIFECIAPAEAKGTKPYLTISGDDNEVCYNTFQNKSDEGQMLSVQGPGNNKMARRTWIHHNYFYNFPPKANNCSAIQIGLSARSMDSSYSLVEYNLFVKCAGENEGAICNKACNNIFRFNTFGEGTEELSLRHGNNCEVYGNFFIGSTGLRFSGDDHRIYSNYFYRCRNAVVCTNGDGEVKEGSKLTCHDRPDRVEIGFNTFSGCINNFRMPGRENGLGATSINFHHNIISGGAAISVEGSYPDGAWSDNILWDTDAGHMPASGFSKSEPNMKGDDYGMNRYGSIPAGNRPLGTGDAGFNGK